MKNRYTLSRLNFSLPLIFLTTIVAILFTSVPVVSQEKPVFDARLDGYDYPFPVDTFEFTSQRQTF